MIDAIAAADRSNWDLDSLVRRVDLRDDTFRIAVLASRSAEAHGEPMAVGPVIHALHDFARRVAGGIDQLLVLGPGPSWCLRVACRGSCSDDPWNETPLTAPD